MQKDKEGTPKGFAHVEFVEKVFISFSVFLKCLHLLRVGVVKRGESPSKRSRADFWKARVRVKMVQQTQGREGRPNVCCWHSEIHSISPTPPPRVVFSFSEEATGNSLYVANLHASVNEDDLQELFAEVGHSFFFFLFFFLFLILTTLFLDQGLQSGATGEKENRPIARICVC